MLDDSPNKKGVSFQETVSVLEAFWFSFPLYLGVLFNFIYLFLALLQNKEKT